MHCVVFISHTYLSVYQFRCVDFVFEFVVLVVFEGICISSLFIEDVIGLNVRFFPV